jgi:hypothetical protein
MAKFHILTSAMSIAFLVLQNIDDSDSQAFWETLLLGTFSFFFISYVPLLYYTLIRDSRFWRSVGIPSDLSVWVDPSPIQPLLCQGYLFISHYIYYHIIIS